MKIGIVAIAIMIVSSILFGMFYKPPMETCITKSYFDSLKDMLIPFGFVLLMVLFAGMGGSDIYDDYLDRKERCKMKIISEETRKKLSIAKSGKNNPAWKGDTVGYASLHEWITNHKLKPELCENCKGNPPRDLHNTPGTYKRNLEDWVWLCRSCHMIEDERLEQLIKRNKSGFVRNISEETRKRMSESRKGAKNPMYGKVSIMKGIPRSEETKRKISETIRNKSRL